MRYIEEYRNPIAIRKLAAEIKKLVPARQVNIMEVCGTHTHSFFRFGIDKLLPKNIRLISGPGCPVCVSSEGYIDNAITLSGKKGVIIATFGDMLRIPGTKTTLEKQKAEGADVRVVYSPMDSLELGRRHPDKKVVFLGVGFETTVPAIGLCMIQAKKGRLRNIYFLCALKLIPPAMKYLVQDKRLKLDGFLCPGHVSSIIGAKAYEFIPRKYKIPCCVSGFEPVDILESTLLLLRQIRDKKARVNNEYSRAVKNNGNAAAKKVMARVFKVADTYWRGFGSIADSGLAIKKEFAQFDAEVVFRMKRRTKDEGRRTKCRCGDVLKGIISPPDCALFAKVCCPENALGPCMVSNEGACSAYYRYKK